MSMFYFGAVSGQITSATSVSMFSTPVIRICQNYGWLWQQKRLIS